jgi:hypothetical protein
MLLVVARAFSPGAGCWARLPCASAISNRNEKKQLRTSLDELHRIGDVEKTIAIFGKSSTAWMA